MRYLWANPWIRLLIAEGADFPQNWLFTLPRIGCFNVVTLCFPITRFHTSSLHLPAFAVRYDQEITVEDVPLAQISMGVS